MNIRRHFVVSVVALVMALPGALAAHEGHGLRVGQVTAVGADSFDLTTPKATLTVKITAETKFEKGGKPADRAELKKGDRVGVETNLGPGGALLADRVVLGLPAPAASR